MKPGPGWGGSCFPKDTRALIGIAEDHGYDFNFLNGVVVVNSEQRDRMVSKIRAAVGGELAGAKIAAWGLTFKANTDDLRESPAVSIIELLVAEGCKVVAYDPTVKAPLAQLPAVEVAGTALDACDGAQALVVLTEWDEFRWADLAEVRSKMAAANIVDTRNLLDKPAALRLGFTYTGVGR
ncbi:MAG: UDP binding domain-containing protein [Ilumatobacteraceae bacterium]